jgi:glycosyltransferase involved in cell wall biosynthesis
MPERRLRVLAIATHPVQYAAPIFRRMAKRAEVEFHVAYCSLRGAEGGHDPDFRTSVKWDIPLLDGYSWTHIPNRGSGAETFGGFRNPGLWNFIRQGHFDAVLCFVGYVRMSFWIAYLAAKTSGSAFLFGTDASSLRPRDGKQWKVTVKKLLWPRLFGLADEVMAPSSSTRHLLESLGIRKDRITLTPYAVDNDWWMQQAATVNRKEIRAAWGASPDDKVILFCAKLQHWKRPADVLRAFAKANISGARLVFAGDGPLRQQLETEARTLGVAERVSFLGFVNQSQLPGVYKAADVMVLPSEYEPFAVVVNEAMCCGCPVIASDRVGAARDLIAPVEPRFIFPCGDMEALAAVLSAALSDPSELSAIGRRCVEHMRTWSPEHNIAGMIEAAKLAVARTK